MRALRKKCCCCRETEIRVLLEGTLCEFCPKEIAEIVHDQLESEQQKPRSEQKGCITFIMKPENLNGKKTHREENDESK